MEIKTGDCQTFSSVCGAGDRLPGRFLFFRSMNEEYTPHHFNTAVAKVYGIPAGIVYNYIEYRSLQTPGRYFPLDLKHLCELYPYMGKWQPD